MTDIEIVRELKLYKKMYGCLFNRIIDAESLATKEEMICFLKNKQLETEKIYMEE